MQDWKNGKILIYLLPPILLTRDVDDDGGRLHLRDCIGRLGEKWHVSMAG